MAHIREADMSSCGLRWPDDNNDYVYYKYTKPNYRFPRLDLLCSHKEQNIIYVMEGKTIIGM